MKAIPLHDIRPLNIRTLLFDSRHSKPRNALFTARDGDRKSRVGPNHQISKRTIHHARFSTSDEDPNHFRQSAPYTSVAQLRTLQ